MDWTNELKQLENEVRMMPELALSADKYQQIHNVLQAKAIKQPLYKRRRKIITASALSAACVAVAVLGVSLYNNTTINSVVRGAATTQTPKVASYALPAAGSSENWTIELKASNAQAPASTPERPRYDFIIQYKGIAAQAHNVMLEEHGIGLWTQDGTAIESEVNQIGTISYGRHTVYRNFTILDQVPELSFTLTWHEGDATKTEHITIPRR